MPEKPVTTASKEIVKLVELGPFPRTDAATEEEMRARADLLRQIRTPLTDEEACALVPLFGDDDCYGLAWTLLHLIETAPGWPLASSLSYEGNEWIDRLRARALRVGHVL